MTSSIDVGDIDAAVGAEKAVVRLGDQDAVLAAEDAAALAQGEFDDAGVKSILFRPSDRFFRGLDRGKVDYAAFGFGDDFVFDDEDVAGLEAEAVSAQRGEQFVGEGVARVDFVQKRDGDEAEFRWGFRPEFLSPFRDS